jgi:hypothetical protein
LAVLVLNVAAFAAPVLFWDFENTTSSGSVSTSIATSYDPNVSGLASQTGGGPAEDFGGSIGMVLLTRFFGTYNPYITFTTADSLYVSDLTFQHFDNHNPGFPSYPGYSVQLQLDSGSGFVNVGSPLGVSGANYGSTETILLGLQLAPGTYTIRWMPEGLAYGSDTNTEFFALNDLSLDTTPEPASLLLLTTGGLALFFLRRLRRV